MNKILYLIALLFAAGSVSAQSYFNGDRVDYNGFYQRKVGFEIDAAVASTVNTVMPNYNTSSITGFTAGITFDFPFIFPVAIAPELLYSQKGYAAITASGNFTQHNQFLDLPFMARIYTGHRLSFFAGPQLSYLISTSSSFSTDFSPSTRPYYNYSGSKFFTAGVLGLGFDVTNYADFHVRYAIDLQGTNLNGNGLVPSYRNQVLQIGLGFKFY
jgi:hypothetical protein